MSDYDPERYRDILNRIAPNWLLTDAEMTQLLPTEEDHWRAEAHADRVCYNVQSHNGPWLSEKLQFLLRNIMARRTDLFGDEEKIIERWKQRNVVWC